jgi:DHA1 family multidrug resistance protein-like MFS transporter
MTDARPVPWRRNLYAAWFVQVLSISGFGFVFPLLPFYLQELGVTDPTEVQLWTGVLASAPALSMALMAPIWGALADKWGKKLMLLRAMVGGAIVLSLHAVVGSVQAMLAVRIIQGVLAGTVTAAGALVATGTPREHMGFALGILSSSMFLGFSVGPAIGGLVAESFGYRTSFLTGGAMLAVGFVLALVLIKEPAADETESSSQGPAEPSERRRARFAFLTGSVVVLLILMFLVRFVEVLSVPFLPLQVQYLRGGIAGSVSISGFLAAARGLVTAVAAATLTRLGDRRSRPAIAGLLLAVASALWLPVFFAGSMAFFTLFLLVATFFVGAVYPLIQAELSTRVQPRQRGLLFGIQTTISNLGWFAAPLVGSAITIQFSIAHVFLTTAIVLGLAAALLTAMLLVMRVRARV